MVVAPSSNAISHLEPIQPYCTVPLPLFLLPLDWVMVGPYFLPYFFLLSPFGLAWWCRLILRPILILCLLGLPRGSLPLPYLIWIGMMWLILMGAVVWLLSLFRTGGITWMNDLPFHPNPRQIPIQRQRQIPRLSQSNILPNNTILGFPGCLRLLICEMDNTCS